MNPGDQTPEPDRSGVWFFVACVFEGGLILVAWVIAAFAGVPLFGDFHWDALDALKGVAATVPPLLFFVWSMNATWDPVRRVRVALEEFARPIFRDFSILQLLIVSIVAGVSEEVLFRAVIQGGLEEPAGRIAALAMASLLFGLVHAVTLGYAVGATVIGVYIGWIWMQGGNLLIPIVIHAAYDFVALTWFVRKTPPLEMDSEKK